MATLVLSLIAFSCGETPRPDEIFVDCSVAPWRSNLGSSRHDIGVLIWQEPSLEPVPEDFLRRLIEFAKLNGELVPALSSDFAQLEVFNGDGSRQPAEIVFDGAAARGSGWNVLSFEFGAPAAWNFFGDQVKASGPFRLDSAPSIVRLVFNPADKRIGVDFSEVVDGNEDASPIEIFGPEGKLNCNFRWGVPHDRAAVRCSEALPSSMTVQLLDGLLSANGNPVTAVDGSPFRIEVVPSELPLQLDGLHAWTPSPL